MSDLSAIRVLNFSGRKEEWPTWSEKFLAKAKRSGIKDVLLQIPKTSEELEEKSEEGRRMMKNADFIEFNFLNQQDMVHFIGMKQK